MPDLVRLESAQVFDGTIAEFRCTAAVGSQAVGFGLRYSIDNSNVVITMHDVEEREGYELVDVAMPALVTVGEQDGAGWLAHSYTGGGLTMVAKAKPGSLPPNRFWGKVLATLPVLMLGHGKTVSILEINSFMDGAEFSVSGE